MDKVMNVGHGEKAKQLFMEGYNCSQAVLGAFCDECGMDFDTAMKMSSSFGGGMGRMREVCGSCSAMFMVAGLVFGYTDISTDDPKKEHYARIQALAEKFKEKHGTIICRELLKSLKPDTNPVPSERTEQYYKVRPCAKFIADAADIIDEMLAGR